MNKDATGVAGRLADSLAQSAWFAALPDDLKADIAPHLSVRRFESGEPLYRQGDPPDFLYFIVSGQVRTVGTATDGQPALLSVLRAGEWTGFLGLLDQGPYPFTTSATTQSEIALLPYAAARRIIGDDVSRLKYFTVPMVAIMRFAYSYLCNTNGRPPMRCVAQRLLDLGRCAYLPDTETATTLTNISQDDIAAATYLTRPTVNRALKSLEAKGAIKLGYGKLDILDIPLLDQIASGGSAAPPGAVQSVPAPITVWDQPEREIPLSSLAKDTLRTGGWFPRLPKATQDEILSVLVVRRFESGEAIYRQGETTRGLYAIVSGQCQIMGQGGDGDTTLMNLLRPGEWTAFIPSIDGGPQPLGLVASRATIAVLLPSDIVTRIFERDAAHYRMLIAPVFAIARFTYDFLIETNRRQPGQLVARRLLHLMRNSYLPETGARSFIEDLNQDDIAMATGLSRPTVNSVLGDMAKRNIVKLGYGKVAILDPEALASFGM